MGRFFLGFIPAVAAIILAAAWNIGTNAVTGITEDAIALAAAGLLLGVGGFAVTVSIIVLSGLAGRLLFPVTASTQGSRDDGAVKRPASGRKGGGTASGLIAAAGAPLSVAPVLGFNAPVLAKLLTVFGGMSILLFGGGYVFIPLIQQIVVDGHGWLTRQEFVDAIALGQVTPGPILISAAFIGYKALLVAREICLGLDHAHRRGIVHRDIKPANIMVGRDGRVVITDFGLAKLQLPDRQETVASTLLGTPLYMSPEQAIGETVDGRSDLFSLGTICYEALTGTQPFRGETYAAVIQKIVNGPPVEPRGRASAIRPETEAIVMKALARDPSKRFRDAAEMASAVESALGPDALSSARDKLRLLAERRESNMAAPMWDADSRAAGPPPARGRRQNLRQAKKLPRSWTIPEPGSFQLPV